VRTIILAAGRSERFAAAGFAKPKSLLPMPDGRTLLEWQVESQSAKHTYIVALNEDKKAFLPTVLKISSRLPKGRSFSGLWLKEQTMGPLDTLWNIRSWLESNEDFLFMYSDILITVPEKATYSHPMDFHLGRFSDPDLHKTDARIVIFESDDARYTSSSILKGYKQGGIFWFRSGADVVEAMRWRPREELNGLPDIFQIINNRKSKDIIIAGQIPWADSLFVDLGTPQDYRNWMAEQGAPLDKDWRPINEPR